MGARKDTMAEAQRSPSAAIGRILPLPYLMAFMIFEVSLYEPGMSKPYLMSNSACDHDGSYACHYCGS